MTTAQLSERPPTSRDEDLVEVRQRRIRPARVVLFLIMAAVAVVMLYPFFYMVDNSFKTQAQYDGSRHGYSISSWHLLFSSEPILRELLNSFIVSAGAVFCVVVISTAAGFALAKIRFRFRTLVFLAIVSCIPR